MLTIEGIYDGGKIKILEDIPFKERKNVLITFLSHRDYEKESETEAFRTPAQVLPELFGSWEEEKNETCKEND